MTQVLGLGVVCDGAFLPWVKPMFGVVYPIVGILNVELGNIVTSTKVLREVVIIDGIPYVGI